MSRLFMLGFEMGHMGNYISKGGSLTVQQVVTSQHRTGARSLYLHYSGDTVKHAFVQWEFDNSSNTVYLRLGLYAHSGGSAAYSHNSFLSLFTSAGEEVLWLSRHLGNELLYFHIGESTYATTKVLNLDQWYAIEIKAKIADSDGIVQVKVDGVVVGETTGDTRAVATAGGDIPGRLLVGYPTHGYLYNSYYDDIAVNNDEGSANNSWIGRGGILALMPTSDVWLGGMEPSTGSDRFACVDEKPPNGDTDYLYNTISPSTVALGLEDLTGDDALGLVSAICWWANARREGAGSQTIEPEFRIGSTSYEPGTAQALGDSYTNKEEIFETSPATSDPWTPTELNAMAAGVRAN